MKLYTVCIGQVPTLVMSTDTELPLPDKFTTNPELIKSLRFQRELKEQISPDAQRLQQLEEVDEALNTWLGEDLTALKRHGVRLWNGDRKLLHVREAMPDEAAKWQASFQRAIDTGELDAGEEDWVTFLVPVDTEDE